MGSKESQKAMAWEKPTFSSCCKRLATWNGRVPGFSRIMRYSAGRHERPALFICSIQILRRWARSNQTFGSGQPTEPKGLWLKAAALDTAAKEEVMIKCETIKIKTLLDDNPSFGCKALSSQFVLVLKTDTGTVVVFQREGGQEVAFLGTYLFGEHVSIDSIFDVEVSAKKHLISLVVCHHDAEGHPTVKDYYIIGDKGEQTSHVTAFFAYEAEPGKSVNCVNIIEEPGSKPVFTDAVRFGKNSARLLKTQLKMYLALAGFGADIREKIVSGGGFLPPSNEGGAVDYAD